MEHTRIIHSGERSFDCGQRGKRFKQEQHLLRRKLTHIGGQPYACHNCGKVFAQMESLIQ